MGSLKGKVLEHPKQQHWRVQFHGDVKVSGNVPETVPDECATTCSLSLLRMIRDKREKEAKKIKEEKIRKMAMEMKEKRGGRRDQSTCADGRAKSLKIF